MTMQMTPNILTQGDKVTGLIDFSDMVYTALVNNLVVACTYVMMNHADPFEWVTRCGQRLP